MIYSWRSDPVKFVREALSAEPLPWQIEALTELGQGEGKVSVRSGHGVGKSTCMAWAALWFLITHFPCKIPCTAPTAHQLEDILWAEMSSWFRKLPDVIKERYQFGADRVELREAPKEAFVVARTARREQPEALQGFHSENLLFLIDEASGIEDIIFEVAEGALSTPGARIFMAGNPTRTQGYFFDSHHRTRSMWWTRRVPVSEVKGTALYSERYVKGVAARYGEGSNVWRVRIDGEFPSGDDDAVIPLFLVEAAINRDIIVNKKEPVVWGLDVARFGDDRTTLCKRRKNAILEPIKRWQNLDNMQVAGVITQEYRNCGDADRPVEICVDVIGLGAGVVDRLRENGLPVRGVNVGEAAPIDQQFFRLRDQLWWKAREFFEDRGARIPDDQDFVSELVQPRYEYMGSGKIKVETKDDVKRRTLHKQSPDLADSFILTFASNRMNAHAFAPIQYPNFKVI